MDAKEYFETKKRMTNNCGNGECTYDCPLFINKNGTSKVCVEFERDYPEKAIAIVENWGKKHPVITRKQKFEELMKEHFPEVVIDRSCVREGAPNLLCVFESCEECADYWNGEYKLPEGTDE